MKALVLIVLAVATIWVWRNHTAADSTFCLTAPERVCVEHVTTSTGRR